MTGYIVAALLELGVPLTVKFTLLYELLADDIPVLAVVQLTLALHSGSGH